MAEAVGSDGDVQNVREKEAVKADAGNSLLPCGVKATEQFP